jgi:hypothetical protein
MPRAISFNKGEISMNKHTTELEEMENDNQNEETSSEHEHEHNCCCENGDISLKEIAYHADDKVDALIQLLMKKKLFTEHEFEEEYNSLFEEDEPVEEDKLN